MFEHHEVRPTSAQVLPLSMAEDVLNSGQNNPFF